MFYSKKITVSIVCSSIACLTFSQEQLGLRLGNYSGIHGTRFNPAFNVSSPLKWDVNLVAAGVFAENNYAFVKDANLFKVIRNRSGYSFAGANNAEVTTNPDGLQYDFTDGKRRKESYINAFLTGPSAMFHVKKHTLGIFYNLRSTSSANRLSSSLGYYDLEALDDGDILHVKPFKGAAMVWSEVGLNYGRNVLVRKKHVVNVGTTLKFLQGYEGAYFQNHQPTTIIMENDFMTYQNAHITYGLSSGLSGYGGADPYDFAVRGYGAAVDIGAVYYIQKNRSKLPYQWKFGLSLVDFGKVAFNKDAQAHEVNTGQSFDFVQGEYAGVEDFDDVFALMSEQSLSDESATFVDDRFSIWVPAVITAFAEKPLTEHLFVNATIVRRLRFKGPVPERDNIWAITPRYERRWFEVSVPLVLYNDKDLRLGAALRLGPLVIGSDNITSWFGKHNFSGSDVYVALRINPANLKSRKGEQKGALMNPDDCFYF